MIQVVDDQFRHEAMTYRLRCTCESCAWFDDEAHRCSHGYPNEEHAGGDVLARTLLVFCKEFELA